MALVLVAFEILTLCCAPVATNEYHTSSSTPVAEQLGAASTDAVALTVVPLVVTPQLKSALTVKDVAPAQLSLAGGGGRVPIQTLKVVV